MINKPKVPCRPLNLTREERQELERLARRPRTARNVSFRARILLASDRGLQIKQVAKELHTHEQTVYFWRRRFFAKRIAGLSDEPRPGSPRKITDEKLEQVIVETLENKPKESTHWSTRLMAERMDLSQSTIARIWRTFGLKPHRADTFTLSSDPLFIEKVRDVVGLYLNPPDNALVLCVDEKSQIQAINRSQPILPMKPGTAERRTPDYDRHGTTSLFAALNVATGNVIGKCFAKHRTVEFRKFLEIVDKTVPVEQQIHLILDNYITHKNATIHRWLIRHTRFHLHFIPTHSSWLNLVERWFALLTERQIKRGAHTSVRQLEKAIEDFISQNNRSPKPFVWTKSAEQIFDRIEQSARYALKAHVDHKTIGNQ